MLETALRCWWPIFTQFEKVTKINFLGDFLKNLTISVVIMQCSYDSNTLLFDQAKNETINEYV